MKMLFDVVGGLTLFKKLGLICALNLGLIKIVEVFLICFD